MNIDALLKGLPGQSEAALVNTRFKAVEKLKAGSCDREWLKLRDAIDSELLSRREAKTGEWSIIGQGEPCYLMRDGAIVAVVVRSKTHGATRGSYHVEVLGEVIHCRERHVKDARKLAKDALAAHDAGGQV
jgi:hypothetical protein